MKRKKIIDTCTWWDDGVHVGIKSGVFWRICGIANDFESEPQVITIPWLTEDIAHQLDDMYYLEHSGDKLVSRTFERLEQLYEDGKPLHPDANMHIAQMCIDKFRDSWNKIYEAITTEYKPLENYDMSQKETPDVTHTKTIKQKVTTENESDVYGFNSNDAVHQSKGKSITSGLVTDNEEKNKETGTRSLDRHGNIGVTTSQQMLQSEIDLRSNYQFVEQLFNDVDSILAMLVY